MTIEHVWRVRVDDLFHGTLSECKKQAVARAIELQASRIDILP